MPLRTQAPRKSKGLPWIQNGVSWSLNLVPTYKKVFHGIKCIDYQSTATTKRRGYLVRFFRVLCWRLARVWESSYFNFNSRGALIREPSRISLRRVGVMHCKTWRYVFWELSAITWMFDVRKAPSWSSLILGAVCTLRKRFPLRRSNLWIIPCWQIYNLRVSPSCLVRILKQESVHDPVSYRLWQTIFFKVGLVVFMIVSSCLCYSFTLLTCERYLQYSKIKFVSPSGHVTSSIYTIKVSSITLESRR